MKKNYSKPTTELFKVAPIQMICVSPTTPDRRIEKKDNDNDFNWDDAN